jgi:hypothetical protein
MTAAGLADVEVLPVEGIAWSAADLDDRMVDEKKQDALLDLLERLEGESSILGASPHLLGVGYVPEWSTHKRKPPPAMPGEAPPPYSRYDLDKRRGEDQADDGHDLDHDVHRRTRGVLERVTDGVTDNRCLVRV